MQLMSVRLKRIEKYLSVNLKIVDSKIQELWGSHNNKMSIAKSQQRYCIDLKRCKEYCLKELEKIDARDVVI